MSFELEAIYENGTLKLDHPLPLTERQRVKVVVQEQSGAASESGQRSDWWRALQDVLAEQKKRGFVGTIAGVDRSDSGYEARMNEILSNTTSGSAGG